MLAQYLDLTAEFNANNRASFEMSNYDYAVIQMVSPSGTIALTATNDSGAEQGVTDGDITTSTNYTTVQATKLADGTAVTSLAAAGLYRIGVVGRYIKFGGASAAATKVLVMLAKIS
jgi:hypothetical protein